MELCSPRHCETASSVPPLAAYVGPGWDFGLYDSNIIERAVEQIHLDAVVKLLIFINGKLLLSENECHDWQPARPGFQPASDIQAFVTLPD